MRPNKGETMSCVIWIARRAVPRRVAPHFATKRLASPWPHVAAISRALRQHSQPNKRKACPLKISWIKSIHAWTSCHLITVSTQPVQVKPIKSHVYYSTIRGCNHKQASREGGHFLTCMSPSSKMCKIHFVFCSLSYSTDAKQPKSALLWYECYAISV